LIYENLSAEIWQRGFYYLSKETGFVSFVANALGPGSDIEKYILAAFVVPKSRLEPEFCTLLNAYRNIWLCVFSWFKRWIFKQSLYPKNKGLRKITRNGIINI